MENPYLPVEAELLRVVEETPTIKTFVLKPFQPIPFRVGQFMQLTLPGVGEAPFTPSSPPYEEERMEITILKTGRVTDALHSLQPGETLGLRGPFGKGYPVDKFVDKEILIVGGGVGLAPLRSLLYYLFQNQDKFKRVSIKYGAKKPEELCYQKLYPQWEKLNKVDLTVTIDVPAPGWKGKVGLVTTLLDDLDIDLKNSYVISCGPEVMLKFVTYKLIDIGFAPEQIYLSMNRNMSCGIGKCGRCIIGKYFLCKDGPDMCYADIKDIPGVFG